MASPGAGPRPSTRFGPYELHELLGMGGMGEVYRAYDTARERMVALKLLRADVAADPSYRDRFRRESRIAARLHEPHVIPVHDFGEINGVLYIDMRLVEGGSVKDELRVTGVLPPARAVSIVAQVAAALDAAHAHGLVHRDVKPENVLLTPDDFAYLVDFGIANGGGEATVTRTGLIIGSCAYMASERLSGKPGGPPSDVYSLTCLLFECLTGRAPFEAADIRQVMSAHMFAPPPRPSEVRQGVSPAFDAVIAKGMAKDPAERYATAGELAKAAAAAVHGGPAAVSPARPGPPPSTRQFSAERPRPYAPQPPPPAPVPRSRFSRTQKALLAGTVAMFALAAGLAAAIVFTGGGTGSQPQSPLAAPPASTTDTSTSTTSTTSTSAAPVSGVSNTDAQGFVGHAARCDSGTLVSAMRTASSLAVICQESSGSYYYHGERLRDGANVRLSNAVPSDGGFDAVNPADGARYQVRPGQLTIISNGRVDSAEPALEYGSAE
ncbi:protein kinase [Mycobacterium antarcticum]|uniref:serine/threonine-protein kinase n=1 Tax=unclassified Mycolicibacterium TaxID=2636767 RepID=UPI0023A6207A|nr:MULTISPECIES: serine/threonine-protein kinase [unclassified Mycolicibacterium]BDX34324.1 protein kinase [Mycolicibacterium sp. TUM20985]GLP77533.1 protein kinase [Mycolicibacterium sp. TUM20983]GLP82070.1 protein kinase [Mycolicibacterium sp. TUM20984]